MVGEYSRKNNNATMDIVEAKETYALERKVGEGAFGEVFRGRDVRTGVIVAVKLLRGERSEVPKAMLRELWALQTIESPHVPRLLAHFPRGAALALVLEYSESDLRRVLDARVDDAGTRLPLPGPVAASWLKDLLTGLKHVHETRLVHRDVKPSNLLIARDGVARLADFGQCRPLTGGDYSHQVSTRWYRAPELLFGAKRYGAGVDIWGAAALFAEMLENQVLFPGNSDIEQLVVVFKKMGTPAPSRWPSASDLPDFDKISFPDAEPEPFDRVAPSASDLALDLLKRTLVLEPAWRLTASQALDHPCFASSSSPAAERQVLAELRVSFEEWTAEFGELITGEFEILAEGDISAHEAAIFVEQEGYACLVFTTKPYLGGKGLFVVDIKRLWLEGPRAGEIQVVHSSRNLANGGTIGVDNRLYFCFQGGGEDPSLPSGIYSVSPDDWGDWETVVENWHGHGFNSPNDIAIRRTDGTIWFTDPSYAYAQGRAPPPTLGEWVWRLDPASKGDLGVVADGFAKPNGIVFSPDEKTLYVTDTGAETGAETGGGAEDSLRREHPRSVYAYDVVEDRLLANRRLLHVADTGVPDGITCDEAGHVYTGCGDGVHVLDGRTGRLLGKIRIHGCDGGAVNLCFGSRSSPYRDTLFILAEAAIVAVKLEATKK
ncbi:hypothetical protein CTAYLR_000104 [Chrysophaeum taylorii]|uniref:Protein kinase domain-containing protein n=1 Tax=Chrysophaeum taylorii TaxID=2483200 RepID=A0AAD7UGI9_9STRA|nr:hypothetical protein CTAYLR_000104 [Chrysophaeum taylorii]